jgi:hypothetical protein
VALELTSSKKAIEWSKVRWMWSRRNFSLRLRGSLLASRSRKRWQCRSIFGIDAAAWRGMNEHNKKCLVEKDSCKAGSLKIEGTSDCYRVDGR